MNSIENAILSINVGSSSIKFALYNGEETLVQLFQGKIENIGLENAQFHFNNFISGEKQSSDIVASDFDSATDYLFNFISKQVGIDSVKAIAHRIVHGMGHPQPEAITNDLLSELKQHIAFAPEHLPNQIRSIEAFQKQFPSLKQFACFDTSFHSAMPALAKQLTIPRKYYAKGIHRYGFHGISYSYLMEELESVAGNENAQGKVILAHLGNGSSMASVKDGKCMDTSMGFTPCSGLMMGTRTGDLDAGVAWYLMEEEKMDAAAFNDLINHQSGLLGISETSGDMQTLLKNKSADPRAAEAIALYCYQAKKWIGAYAAVLGGLDTLIFSGGVGENAPEVRSRICSGLQFLGIEIDEERNAKNEGVISRDASKVCVRVMKTNEELMMAKSVSEAINNSNKN